MTAKTLTDLIVRRNQEREAPPNPAPPVSAPAIPAPPIGTPEPVPLGAAPNPAPPPEREGLWTAFPHTFWDDLAPTLDPLEVAILGHLVRLTVGYRDRPTCVLGLPRLAERCNVGLNTVRRAVARLERRGLIRRTDVHNTGHNRDRGTIWEVLAAPAKTARAKSAPAKTGRARTGAMISEKTEENMADAPAPADPYELRTVAARFHHAYPDESHDARVERVVSSLVGQGRAVTREAVEEALRGLAL